MKWRMPEPGIQDTSCPNMAILVWVQCRADAELMLQRSWPGLAYIQEGTGFARGITVYMEAQDAGASWGCAPSAPPVLWLWLSCVGDTQVG